MMIECAWAAIKTKNTYLRSKYYSLIPRMGKKKALAAIAHKMVIACYFHPERQSALSRAWKGVPEPKKA